MKCMKRVTRRDENVVNTSLPRSSSPFFYFGVSGSLLRVFQAKCKNRGVPEFLR